MLAMLILLLHLLDGSRAYALILKTDTHRRTVAPLTHRGFCGCVADPGLQEDASGSYFEKRFGF